MGHIAIFFFLFGKISSLGDKENCTVNPAKDFFGEKNPIKLP